MIDHSSRHSSLRDSKCRSQYDNFSPTSVGETVIELSSSTEALETLDEANAVPDEQPNQPNQIDSTQASIQPLLGAILEKNDTHSSSSTENILNLSSNSLDKTSKLEFDETDSDNDR